MSIEITTDRNGCQMITLTDVARFGRHGRGLQVKNIFVRACDGHVFNGTSRLGEAEVDMVKFYFHEKGGPREVNIFEGDTPPRRSNVFADEPADG